MSIEYEDEVEQFERERRAARESKNAPFFFALKDGQRAKVHFLMEYRYAPAATLAFHQLYNQASGQFEVNCVCAQEVGESCEICERARRENNWKLKAVKHTYIPVYVHAIKKRENNAWVPLTYTQDGQEKPVSGVRFLDEKTKTSTILEGLYLAYTESSDSIRDRTICKGDFVIARSGSGLDTTYSVSPLPTKPEPLPDDTPLFTPEEVKAAVIKQRPPLIVGGSLVKEEEKADTAESAFDDDLTSVPF